MFDRYVADTRPSWKRRAWALASIGAHGIGGAVVLWFSMHVAKAAVEEIQVKFVKTVAAAPPALLPPPPSTQPVKPRSDHPSTQPVRALVQPIAIPTAPPKSNKKTGDDDDSWDTGPVGEGCPPNTICKVEPVLKASAPPPPPPPPPPPTATARQVTEYQRVSRAPRLLSGAREPDIPPSLLQQLRGSQGVVLARIRINARGGVDSVSIASSTLPQLDGVVKSFILNNWRFEPPMAGGVATAVEFLQPFSFNF
jgi:TonB family protein